MKIQLGPKHKPAGYMIAAGVILLLGYSGCTPKSNPDQTAKDSASDALTSKLELKADMRKLWEDHVVWTRNVIFCIVDKLPGADEAVARLLKNQEDIGGAVRHYYGGDAGAALTKLLKEHITIAAEVVTAARDDKKDALNDANKRWYANADAISVFLSNANPNWPLADMKMMMHDHLELTTDEAVQRIKKNYAEDVKSYDKVHDEILKMSDMLSDGIVKQFPNKF